MLSRLVFRQLIGKGQTVQTLLNTWYRVVRWQGRRSPGCALTKAVYQLNGYTSMRVTLVRSVE